MQYSIWLLPPQPIYTQLESIIDDLAKHYDGPKFEPHMTLIGGFKKSLPEIKKKVKQLSANIDKLELSLGSVSFSTTYFQSVFIRVNSNAKLMQLNLDAKKLFGMNNDVFMPHISLLYGEHTMATREKVVTQVKLPQASFVIREFTILPVTADLRGWKPVAAVPFG